MDLILKIAEWLINRSDPMLVVAFVALAVWQHRSWKMLAKHLDPNPDSNPYPHPQCKLHQTVYESLKKHMDAQHEEVRSDISELRQEIRDVFKIAVDK